MMSPYLPLCIINLERNVICRASTSINLRVLSIVHDTAGKVPYIVKFHVG